LLVRHASLHNIKQGQDQDNSQGSLQQTCFRAWRRYYSQHDDESGTRNAYRFFLEPEEGGCCAGRRVVVMEQSRSGWRRPWPCGRRQRLDRRFERSRRLAPHAAHTGCILHRQPARQHLCSAERHHPLRISTTLRWRLRRARSLRCSHGRAIGERRCGDQDVAARRPRHLVRPGASYTTNWHPKLPEPNGAQRCRNGPRDHAARRRAM
jgi:hypothetical protein